MLDLDKEADTNEQYVRRACPNRMPNGSIESTAAEAAGEIPDSTAADNHIQTKHLGQTTAQDSVLN